MKVVVSKNGSPLLDPEPFALSSSLPSWIHITEQGSFCRILLTNGGAIILEEEYLGASTINEDRAPMILESVRRGEIDHLHHFFSAANGVFAAVIVCFTERRVACISDTIGVAPIYIDRRRTSSMTFSTALPNFIDDQRRNPDLAGALQRVTVGVPLGTRTLLAGVSRLMAGEALLVDLHRGTSTSHVREVVPGVTSVPEEDWPEMAEECFNAAVIDRLEAEGSDVQYCYLSGGLDSRVVVASLLKHSPVEAFTFSRPGTQEHHYAELFANANGVSLSSFAPSPDRNIDWTGLMSSGLAKSGIHGSQSVWSGDGGSVGCGAVYCTDEIAGFFRLSPRECTDHMMRYFGIRLPSLLSKSSDWRLAVEQTREDLEAEISRARNAQDDRASHVFFMLNDQHRHLDLHFDRREAHQIRFLLPFFDRRVIQAWLSLPLEPRLYHRLYMKWFERFDASVRSTPWQTYPGHVACPIPDASGFAAQWENGFWPEREANTKRGLRRGTLHTLLRGSALEPSTWIGMAAALALDSLGLRSQPAVLALATELADLGRGGFQR